MAIPDYQTCMLPFLRFLGDGVEHTLRDAEDAVATTFGLTPVERAELLPSGQQGIFRNRVGWARTYLKKGGLLESPRRGVFKITTRGQEVLASDPKRIDAKYLERFPEFMAFRDAGKQGATGPVPSPAVPLDATPEETIEVAYEELRAQLSQDILVKILSCSPAFFEQLVVELLVKMGYGGSRKDAGERIGQTGDGGVDGIIKEDRLGLDTIFLQAKRWQGVVGRPEIQKFVGALQGQRAKKGVFITTSAYTAEAIEYAARIDTKVVLIDGTQLSNLMIDFELGVSPQATFTVKRLDSDYFDES
jgi:restriction system protein